jgi:hypothetical protein
MLKHEPFCKKILRDIAESYVVMHEKAHNETFKRPSILSSVLTKKNNSYDSDVYFKSKLESILEDGEIKTILSIEENTENKTNVLNFLIEDAVNSFKASSIDEDKENLEVILKEAIKSTFDDLYTNGSAMFANELLANEGEQIVIAMIFSVYGAEATIVAKDFLEIAKG